MADYPAAFRDALASPAAAWEGERLESALPSPSSPSRSEGALERSLRSRLGRTEGNLEWVDSLITRARLSEPLERKRSPRSPSSPRPLGRSVSETALLPRRVLGRERSKYLLSSLFDLRRAGNPRLTGAPEPEASCKVHPGCTACSQLSARLAPVPVVQDVSPGPEDSTLMELTIADCEDTPDSLERTAEMLRIAQKPAGDYGGARHATSCVSKRTLQVVERKCEVLKKLVESLAGYEAACRRKVPLITAVIRGAFATEAGAAIGIREVIAGSIHPGGKPQEADKSMFQVFVTTFKLPAFHRTVLRAQALFREQEVLWADDIARLAKEEVDREKTSGNESPESVAAEAVKRLEELAVGIGVTHANPRLTEIEMLSIAARAAAVLRHAEGEARKDAKAALAGEKGDAAQTAALRVEASVKAGVAWGVEKSHPSMFKALIIAKDLRAAGVHRYAQHQVRSKKDALGEAEKAADRIDEAIRTAVKAGVNVAHDFIQAAQKLSLQAREEEGLKKRLANAEKRKLEKEKEAQGTG